eukprot:2161855-Rhodomonas_salina.1
MESVWTASRSTGHPVCKAYVSTGLRIADVRTGQCLMLFLMQAVLLFTSDNAAIYIDNAAIYGDNAAIYGDKTAIYGDKAAIYGDNAAIYGDNAAVYGREEGGGTLLHRFARGRRKRWYNHTLGQYRTSRRIIC